MGDAIFGTDAREVLKPAYNVLKRYESTLKALGWPRVAPDVHGASARLRRAHVLPLVLER